MLAILCAHASNRSGIARPGMVLLMAEAGSGKTTVYQCLADLVADGFIVRAGQLPGQCHRVAGHPAGDLADMLDRLPLLPGEAP